MRRALNSAYRIRRSYLFLLPSAPAEEISSPPTGAIPEDMFSNVAAVGSTLIAATFIGLVLVCVNNGKALNR